MSSELTMHTPATLIRTTGDRTTFKQLPLGETFESNGNVWTKKTTRTATGVWPAILPATAYFKGGEPVHREAHCV